MILLLSILCYYKYCKFINPFLLETHIHCYYTVIALKFSGNTRLFNFKYFVDRKFIPLRSNNMLKGCYNFLYEMIKTWNRNVEINNFARNRNLI